MSARKAIVGPCPEVSVATTPFPPIFFSTCMLSIFCNSLATKFAVFTSWKLSSGYLCKLRRHDVNFSNKDSAPSNIFTTHQLTFLLLFFYMHIILFLYLVHRYYYI